MGLLRRLFGLDDRGGEPDRGDPDGIVWVATVALWQAPLVVHGLAEEGVDATFTESSARRMTYGGAPAARIYVHQVDRAHAERIILDLTRTGPGPGG